MGSLRLGRLSGIPVDLRFSFVFLLLFAFYGGILQGLGANAVFVLLLGCASVLFHEIGHAFTARILGVPVVSIQLHALGGECCLAGMPRRPRDEILTAAAGPLMSLLLAGGGGILLLATNSIWAEVLIAVNLLLAGANLVPALPLDGGRILRAALVPRFGARAATARAVVVSRVIAVCVAIGGPIASEWISGTWILLPLAAMLWSAAGREPQYLEQWTSVGDAPPDARVEVLDQHGRPAGRRATTLGSTYVIEEHSSPSGMRWVVRDLGGKVLLVTDTPLGGDTAARDGDGAEASDLGAVYGIC